MVVDEEKGLKFSRHTGKDGSGWFPEHSYGIAQEVPHTETENEVWFVHVDPGTL